MNIYLPGNYFTHISNNICNKNGWTSGNIGDNGEIPSVTTKAT